MHQSIDFTASWNKDYGSAKTTLLENYIVAPDGTLNGTYFTRTTGQGSGRVGVIYNSNGATIGNPYTNSFYVKSDGGTQYINLAGPDASSGQHNATFDILNGTVSSVGDEISASIEDVGNGWYRCIVTDTAVATIASYIWIYSDNVPEGRGIYVWGAQQENGKFATSFIQTNGSTVTRAGDYAKVTNALDFFNPNEGTFYVDQYIPFDYSTDYPTRYILATSGMLIIYKNSNSNSINTYDGTTGLSRTSNTPGRNKVMMGYSLSEAEKSLTLNGSNVANTLNGLDWRMVSSNQTINFGQESNNHGHIKKIAYYPQYLSTSQKIALTEE